MQANALSEAFDQWCQSRTLAEHTLRSYLREGSRLRRWWSMPGVRRTFDEVTAVRLCEALSSRDEGVLASLGITRPLKSGSLLQSKRILSAFFLWLALRAPAALVMAVELRKWRPAASAPAVMRSLAVGPEGAAQLLTQAPSKADSPRLLRDQWIRQLVFWSNASRGELAALRMRDIRVSKNQLQVRLPIRAGGLGWTILPPLCLEWWLAYRRSVPAGQGAVSPVLRSLTRPTAGLSEASISRIVSGTDSSLVISGGTPTLRSLRREFVALGYRSGLPEGALARQMRLARVPVGIARPSVSPVEAIASLADQFISEARSHVRMRTGVRVTSR